MGATAANVNTFHRPALDDVYPRVLDWQQIITDLTDVGLTYEAQSRMLGIAGSTFQRYRNGCEPRHSIGSAILLIHARYCGSGLTRQRVSEADH